MTRAMAMLAVGGMTLVMLTPAAALKGNSCSECNRSCLAFCQSIHTKDPPRYPRCLDDCQARMTTCKSFAFYKNCGENLKK